MIPAMLPEPTLLHVYAWRRGDDGPYFIGTSDRIEEGVSIAETTLKDCRRGFVRAEVHDARQQTVVWPQRPGDRTR